MVACHAFFPCETTAGAIGGQKTAGMETAGCSNYAFPEECLCLASFVDRSIQQA